MKDNGEMLFSCGYCDGCPAIPLSKEQCAGIMKQLMRSQSLSDKELARKFTNMQVFAVACECRGDIILAEYREKGLL